MIITAGHMKFFCGSLLLFSIILSGCTGKASVFSAGNFYTSTLYFASDASPYWTITQPPRDQWRIEGGYLSTRRAKYRPEYTPEYFPTYFSSGDRQWLNNDNFFYAVGRLEDESEIAAWVLIDDSLKIEKRVYYDIWNDRIPEISDEMTIDRFNSCKNAYAQHIRILFNRVAVQFDSASVYLETHGETVHGIEIPDAKALLYRAETEVCVPATYDLASPETAEKKKPFGRNWDDDPRKKSRGFYIDLSPEEEPLPVFRYRFPSTTCKDLEGAVLVIDGLYRHGERLPPLRVRMRYYDFSLMPEYVEAHRPEPR